MFLDVDYLRCTGCQICETVCSYKNAGVMGGNRSRIKIQKNEEKGIFLPLVCRHCSKPQCVEVCPTNALKQDEKTGIVRLNKEECIGCRKCINECPFGAIGFNGEFPFKCELCGGDPECVKACPVNALKVRKDSDITTESQKKLCLEKFSKAVRLNTER